MKISITPHALIGLLSNDSYVTLNKNLVSALGIYEAYLLSYLITRYNLWLIKEALTEDHFFFCTREEIEENTTICEKAQRRLLTSLEEKGYITTSLRGVPAKKYYKINIENIATLFQ